jgi:hypothetical protein
MKAIERGVQIRLINEEIDGELKGSKILKTLVAPHFEIRYVREPLRVSAGVYDGREAILYVYPTAERMPTPCLYSNNPSFVSVCQEYFERVWETAFKYEK